MTDRLVSTDVKSLHSDVLDHARDFAELVSRKAPGEYRALLSSGRLQRHLAADNNFNHGKLFAYAEFLVFRREFTGRFPEASGPACINAFCSLFLKNDISMTNLIEFVEKSAVCEELPSP